MGEEKHSTAYEEIGEMWQFTRLTFEVTNGVTAFQKAINTIDDGVESNVVDIDDLIFGGATEAEHDKPLAKFRLRVQKYNLKINKEKSKLKLGVESPHNRLFGFTRRSSLNQNYIDFDKSDVQPTCSSSTSDWMSHGSAVFMVRQNFTKKSKDDSLVQAARILRLFSPQYAVISYPEENLIDTVATKFISKGPEPDPANTSEQNLTEIPTKPDTVALDTSRELPPAQANFRCKKASSPVKTVESPPDVGLNLSRTKQSLKETSTPPIREVADSENKGRESVVTTCLFD